jgi:actin-like ATPase involved in cell morphogenesis
MRPDAGGTGDGNRRDLSVDELCDTLVADVGAGKTEIAVISRFGMVSTRRARGRDGTR